MNSLLKLWAQPSWIKWIVYLAIVYILFLIKEAFAIVLWFLFVSFYIISFLLITYLKQGLIMKKIIFIVLFFTFYLVKKVNRPHGSQHNYLN